MKFLIIKPSSLGDVIHGMRVVTQIKKSFGNVIIDWVIKDSLEEIIKASNLVRKTYLLNRGQGLKSYIRLVQEVRKIEYDYILDLQGLLRSGIITFFGKAKNKLGVADGRECSTLFFNPIGEKSRAKEIHAVDRLIPFLEELGVHKYNKELPISFLPPEDIKELSKLSVNPYIILFPESRRIEKVWPHFQKLSCQIKNLLNHEILVCGNNRDEDFNLCTDLRGKLRLKDLPKIIKGADLIISNDSGPLHIASAVGTPTVSLFGPTSFKRYGPYPSNISKNKVLNSRDGQMNSITLQSVIDAAKDLIDR